MKAGDETSEATLAEDEHAWPVQTGTSKHVPTQPLLCSAAVMTVKWIYFSALPAIAGCLADQVTEKIALSWSPCGQNPMR